MKTNHSFEKHKALLFLYLFNYKPSQVTGIIKGAEKLFFVSISIQSSLKQLSF